MERQEWLERQSKELIDAVFEDLDGSFVPETEGAYDALYRDIMASLSDLYAKSTTEEGMRLDTLPAGLLPFFFMSVRSQLQNVNRQVAADMTEKLENYFEEAYGFHYDLIPENSEINLTTNESPLLNIVAIREVLNEPLEGLTYNDRFEIASNNVGQALSDILQNAIITGLALAAVARQVKEKCDQAAYYANRIAQTETGRIVNEAAMRAYRDRGVYLVKWVLGNEMHKMAPCPTCREKAHGGERGEGIYDINVLPALPQHPFCRCTIYPWNF